jgi:hypothetical protein
MVSLVTNAAPACSANHEFRPWSTGGRSGAMQAVFAGHTKESSESAARLFVLMFEVGSAGADALQAVSTVAYHSADFDAALVRCRCLDPSRKTCLLRALEPQRCSDHSNEREPALARCTPIAAVVASLNDERGGLSITK